jgi:hypothetical protein
MGFQKIKVAFFLELSIHSSFPTKALRMKVTTKILMMVVVVVVVVVVLTFQINY